MSCSSGTDFMDRNEDFVLKLKVEAGDGTAQLRRIRLHRIANDEGIISYDELVGLVVTFVVPEHPLKGDAGFHVTITYKDCDDDQVTIGSTDELIDAVEQFARQRVLRITAEVKPKMNAPARISKATPSKATPASPSGRRHKRHSQGGNVTQNNPSTPETPLHSMLESFVGVLAKAVMTLQEGLSVPAAPPKRINSSTDAPQTTVATEPLQHDSSTNQTQHGTDGNGNHGTFRAVRSSNVVEGLNRAPVNRVEGVAHASRTEFEDTSEKGTVTGEFEGKPFIHGRHTCDSCLKTPIIGKRYHAKNLPDYDLCGRCFENYRGTGVDFEPVELVRDRAFQERWHRRHERRARIRHGAQPESDGQGNQESDETGHQPDGHRQVEPSQDRNNGDENPSHVHEFDDALKEAIRRSLQDFALKKPESMPAGKIHAPVDSTNTMVEEEIVLDSTSIAVDEDAAPQVISEPAAAIVEVNRVTEDLNMEEIRMTVVKEVATAGKNQQLPSLENTSSLANETNPTDLSADTQTADKGLVVDVEQTAALENLKVESDLEETQPGCESDEDAVARLNAHLAMTRPKVLDQDHDDNSEVSEPLIVSSDGSIVMKPEPPKSPRSTPSKHREAEESFASDAVGSGDIAEAMGATLDMVADMITEMLSEADAHNVAFSDDDADSDGDASSSHGLILESVNAAGSNANNDVASESDSWDLVSTGSEDKEQPPSSQDKDIARAAEMLGSALFNSDMKSSAEAISAMSNSNISFPDSCSAVSSVPSILASLSSGASVSAASNALPSGWAGHLEQLHELGFENTAKSMEILERMAAARIAAGSDEVVTVTQVVDELLKQYESP